MASRLVRRLVVGFLGGLLSVGTLAAAPRPGPAAEPIEIRASVTLPASHPVIVSGWKAFQDAVQADPEAEIRFRVFVNGAVLGSERALKGLSQGEADMGFLAPADHPDEFPYATFLTALSLVGKDGLAAAAALTDLVLLRCEPCRDEFTRKNLVFLGTYSAAPYLLMATEPLADAKSLTGRQIWTPGSLWDYSLREMGALPVPSGKDAHAGLTSEGAEAIIEVPTTLQQQPELLEQITAITLLPFGAYRGASPFTVNRDVWRKLSDRQRRALLAAAPAGIAAATLAYQQQAREALAVAQERGVALVEPDVSLVRLLESVARANTARIAESVEASFGIADAASLLENYESLYGKYLALLQSAPDAERATEVLRREIFLKVPSGYGIDGELAAKETALPPAEDDIR